MKKTLIPQEKGGTYRVKPISLHVSERKKKKPTFYLWWKGGGEGKKKIASRFSTHIVYVYLLASKRKRGKRDPRIYLYRKEKGRGLNPRGGARL